MSPLFLMFWLLLAISALAAARWGGWAEKIVALLYVAAAGATVVARPAFELRYAALETCVFAVDLLLFAALAMVAVRSGRWWTICASALQCLTVLSHVGKMLNPGLWRLGYQLMATWAAYPAVLLLLAGVWSEKRRTRNRR